MKRKSIGKRVWQRQQRATSGSKDDDPLEVFEVQSIFRNLFIYLVEKTNKKTTCVDSDCVYRMQGFFSFLVVRCRFY